MSNSIKERILSVYKGETPDTVPYMLDLSHWFYQKNKMQWNLMISYEKPETELIDYHKKMDVGFYMPNNAAFYTEEYGKNVVSSAEECEIDGNKAITWTISTSNGEIKRTRIWSDVTYAWGIHDWGISTEEEINILGEALSSRTYSSDWTQYNQWDEYVGDSGVVYLPCGYSAIGQLLNYWMGIENTLFATVDYPDTMGDFVDKVNANNLECIKLLAKSPAEVILLGDNISSDIQPPSFFKKWSKPFYDEAIRILHDAGKYVAVHIDGRLRGAISMVRDTGADCADAVTPTPMGDLNPAECRAEAGKDFILSGGVSPDLWLPNATNDDFVASVISWLDLRKQTPRLIANAGDQVPPGAVEERIEIMRDLIEKYGKY